MIQLCDKNPSRICVIQLSYKHSNNLKTFMWATFYSSSQLPELPLSPCSFQPHPFPDYAGTATAQQCSSEGREWARWKRTRLHTSQPAGSFPHAVAQAFVQVQWKRHERCFGQYYYQKMLRGTIVSLHQPVYKLQKFLDFLGYLLIFISLEIYVKKFLPKEENTTQL